jgi:hypothetical protein
MLAAMVFDSSRLVAAAYSMSCALTRLVRHQALSKPDRLRRPGECEARSGSVSIDRVPRRSHHAAVGARHDQVRATEYAGERAPVTTLVNPCTRLEAIIKFGCTSSGCGALHTDPFVGSRGAKRRVRSAATLHRESPRREAHWSVASGRRCSAPVTTSPVPELTRLLAGRPDTELVVQRGTIVSSTSAGRTRLTPPWLRASLCGWRRDGEERSQGGEEMGSCGDCSLTASIVRRAAPRRADQVGCAQVARRSSHQSIERVSWRCSHWRHPLVLANDRTILQPARSSGCPAKNGQASSARSSLWVRSVARPTAWIRTAAKALMRALSRASRREPGGGGVRPARRPGGGGSL